MAVPNTPHYHRALAKGDTLVRLPCIHWVEPWQEAWVEAERATGARIVAVELADDAVPLALLKPARERTIVLLGHEHHGVPAAMLDLADTRVEIPPASASGRAERRPGSAGGLITASLGGVGQSLNVAVAGSLVAYRLAGLA
jgi:tRNA G18 (ribose-2'-O)-methylase SpoU